MTRKSLLLIIPLLATFICCGKQDGTSTVQEEEELTTTGYEAINDSMIYGLACDGCNDSILVLLPDSGGDPINYNILQAMRQNKVFGRPRIGDKMALMVSPDDPYLVTMLIDLEKIQGTWYYEQLPIPRFRERTDSNGNPIPIPAEAKLRFDSMIQTLMIPKEYVYTLKRDFTVSSSGGPGRKTSLDDSPVDYPRMKRYNEWHIYNGRIIFTRGGMRIGGNDSIKLENDTAEFVELRRDSLKLRFKDHIQKFLPKRDSLSEKQ